MRKAIISVRASSSRFPRKCFAEIVPGKSVLQHVIERCMLFGFEPIVATTRSDTEIVALCAEHRVLCHAGAVADKLARWHALCHRFGVNSFVTVDCDDPLFDPVLTTAVHDQAKGTLNYVVKPDTRAYLGSCGWAMSRSTLDAICESKKSINTEMIWKHFPAPVLVDQFDAKPTWIEKNIRLTLDYDDDLILIRTVLRELGESCDRAMIVDFFRNNPGLVLVNEYRNDEWSKRQNAS